MAENEKVINRLKELAPNGKLSCTQAHRLADELKISPEDIGKVCDELKIKIASCELGCF